MVPGGRDGILHLFTHRHNHLELFKLVLTVDICNMSQEQH